MMIILFLSSIRLFRNLTVKPDEEFLLCHVNLLGPVQISKTSVWVGSTHQRKPMVRGIGIQDSVRKVDGIFFFFYLTRLIEKGGN